jgi:hypothetical protein
MKFLLLFVAFCLVSLPALATDSATVTVGPARYQALEPAGSETIVMDRVFGRDYLMVEPKIGTFTGLTYKFGIAFTAADYSKVTALKEGKSTSFKIKPISDNNFGKSTLSALFRQTKKSGAAIGVEVDPGAAGQLTSGTVTVRRLKGDNDDVLVFVIKGLVKKLIVTNYPADGSPGSTKTIKAASSIAATIRVTR